MGANIIYYKKVRFIMVVRCGTFQKVLSNPQITGKYRVMHAIPNQHTYPPKQINRQRDKTEVLPTPFVNKLKCAPSSTFLMWTSLSLLLPWRYPYLLNLSANTNVYISLSPQSHIMAASVLTSQDQSQPTLLSVSAISKLVCCPGYITVTPTLYLLISITAC